MVADPVLSQTPPIKVLPEAQPSTGLKEREKALAGGLWKW